MQLECDANFLFIMNVLLIRPPYTRLRKMGQAPYFPLGIGYIAGVLKDEGVAQIEAKNYESYVKAGININKVTQLSYLTIHEPHFATITGNDSNNFHQWVTEGFTSNPKFTVAAGDHFNGALLVSILQGLSPEESLVIANAATAIFVRTGV